MAKGVGLLWVLAVAAVAAEKISAGSVAAVAAEKINEARLSRFASVGTFNTYLYNGAPAVEERKNVLIRTLQGKNENGMPDILCLQEVWTRSVAADIARQVRNNYPYHASFQDLSNDPSSRPACSKDEIESYRTCLQRCPTPPPSIAMTNCTLASCSDIKARLTQSCYSCLALESRYRSGDVSQPNILDLCSSNIPESDYTSPYGILLLSKYQLNNITSKKFFDSPHKPAAIPRGYIAAKIDDYTFVCTHLQALLPLYYDGPPQFTSYEEEQANEIKVLLQLYKGRSDVVILGDFNHGPAAPGCTAEAPVNYNLMVSNRLLSATVRWINTCTYCNSNTFLEKGTDASSVLDHIYIHSNVESAVVEVCLMFDTHYTTDPVMSHLSDHFGVRALLDFSKLRESDCPAPDPFRVYSKLDSAL